MALRRAPGVSFTLLAACLLQVHALGVGCLPLLGEGEAALQGCSGHIERGQLQLQQCWQVYTCTHVHAHAHPLLAQQVHPAAAICTNPADTAGQCVPGCGTCTASGCVTAFPNSLVKVRGVWLGGQSW